MGTDVKRLPRSELAALEKVIERHIACCYCGKQTPVGNVSSDGVFWDGCAARAASLPPVLPGERGEVGR